MLRPSPSVAAPSCWFTPSLDEKPFEAWLKRELRREHDGALQEVLPQEWLDLLEPNLISRDELTRH